MRTLPEEDIHTITVVHSPERDPFDEVAHAWGKHAGCSQEAVLDGILCLDCVTHGVRLEFTAGRVDSNNQFFWK
ncbi:hypothetical protein GCM10022207_14070 [Streptomyces lannensis]|uniref:Uncharacterized protein n=1 Tax=Streptomyces lannensis TaxID=766498 RepID=A0ABP7JRP1_9ACTN